MERISSIDVNFIDNIIFDIIEFVKGVNMFHKDLFGTRLRKLRKLKKESQQEIGELIGVNPNQVSEMENGHTTTTFEKLYLLCEHFNVSADYLLGLTNELRPLWEKDNKNV